MKSVVRASVRMTAGVFVVGACAVFATACLEGDPIPEDVIQRSEAVLLEGATGGVSPGASASTSASAVAPAVAPATSVAPAGVTPLPPGSGFQDNGLPPALPEANELGEELDDVIPEDAIPLDEYLRQ